MQVDETLNNQSKMFCLRQAGLFLLVIGRYSVNGSDPVPVLQSGFLRFHGIGCSTSVLIPTSPYQGFGTRFLGDSLHFSHLGTTSSVPFWFQIR